jgi:hypothetical protein
MVEDHGYTECAKQWVDDCELLISYLAKPRCRGFRQIAFSYRSPDFGASLGQVRDSRSTVHTAQLWTFHTKVWSCKIDSTSKREPQVSGSGIPRLLGP